MGRMRHSIIATIAVVALVATPTAMAACLALCVPDAASLVPAHSAHASHHARPPVTATASHKTGHAAHAVDQEPAGVDLLTAAGHGCCHGDAAALLLAAPTGRTDASSLAVAASPVPLPGLLPPGAARRPPAGRSIPPPSPPPASLVLRI